MYDAARPLLYVFVSIPVLAVAYLVFAAIGFDPLNLFLLVLAGIAVMATMTWLDRDGADGTERTNCPDCGAPNPVENASCGYCDAPLAGAESGPVSLANGNSR